MSSDHVQAAGELRDDPDGLVRRGRIAMMLAVMLAELVALGGCPNRSSGECQIDRDCSGGEVCGRDQVCADPSAVRPVMVTWTVQGAAASTLTCQAHPDLFISFIGRDLGDTLGYAPVPCNVGQYTIDKLPDRFGQVELGVEGGTSRIRPIDGSNTVAFDLP